MENRKQSTDGVALNTIDSRDSQYQLRCCVVCLKHGNPVTARTTVPAEGRLMTTLVKFSGAMSFLPRRRPPLSFTIPPLAAPHGPSPRCGACWDTESVLLELAFYWFQFHRRTVTDERAGVSRARISTSDGFLRVTAVT
ncbi:hypothetical protein EVAR_51280_1 [Eumeta japonica]|uniref:Uncharacterized protein n=1 Tax=Eumeta variegata TaxID=151549 RepID=A0A4C1Y707_EUMVA|nr:hypothetical protein EVAR_51280_1 [Eumeta japonica]